MATLEKDCVVAFRFRLERPLGKGGMGEVWLAQHMTLDMPCAVKFIREDRVSDLSLNRFRQEALSAAKLRSPNVVQMLDHGVYEGTPYIAMELLDGETLRERLGREGRLAIPTTLAIVRDVARALVRAAELGIVHRDLKPDNLVIVQDADREIVKVLDFGVAKVPVSELSAEQRTRTGALVGTPYYMSPEQARGDRSVDGRSDLWSLAVITYQCLTGRLPFEQNGLGALLTAILRDPIPVPSEVAPDLPHRFDGWWRKATERDPDARFQDAASMVDALEQALKVDPQGQATRPDGTREPSPLALRGGGETLPLANEAQAHPATAAANEPASALSTSALSESTHVPLSADARRADDPSPIPNRRLSRFALPVVAAALLSMAVYAAVGASEEATSADPAIPGEVVTKAQDTAAPAMESAAPGMESTAPGTESTATVSSAPAVDSAASASPTASATASTASRPPRPSRPPSPAYRPPPASTSTPPPQPEAGGGLEPGY